MDRRLTPANTRAALESLRGTVVAPRYTPGGPAQVAVALADLLKAPEGYSALAQGFDGGGE